MRKTLIVTTDFFPSVGGVSTYWQRVCASLPPESFCLLTIPNESNQTFPYQIKRKSLFFRWLWPKWLKGVFVIAATTKEVGAQQLFVDQLLPVGSMAYLLNKAIGVEYFVQVHGLDLLSAKRSKRKQILAKNILSRAEHIFVNSKATGKLLEEFGID